MMLYPMEMLRELFWTQYKDFVTGSLKRCNPLDLLCSQLSFGTLELNEMGMTRGWVDSEDIREAGGTES